MWIDATKELGSYLSLIGLYSSLPSPENYGEQSEWKLSHTDAILCEGG
jgi:hypothetical protein